MLVADYARPEVARPALDKFADAEAFKRAGPTPVKRIKPYNGTNLRGLDIVKGPKAIEGLDQYEFLDPYTVRFRGQVLKSGDLFAADLALPSDGGLGTFLTPRSHFTHGALFVVLEVEGKRFPVVLEMHEKGNRIVPLANFLGEHTYYAETYRVANPPADWGRKLSDEVQKMMNGERLSYDFQARDVPVGGILPAEQMCATCTTLPQIILKRTGVEIPLEKSSVIPGAKRNLDYLGMTMVDGVTMPTDVARSGLELVGVFDNRRLKENLSRELTIGHAEATGSAGHGMSHGDLDLLQLPQGHFLMKALELNVAQGRGLVGMLAPLVVPAFGFQVTEIPKSAPPNTVAFYVVSTEIYAPVTTQFASSCTRLTSAIGANEPLALTKLEAEPAISAGVRAQVDAAGISRWYHPRK